LAFVALSLPLPDFSGNIRPCGRRANPSIGPWEIEAIYKGDVRPLFDPSLMQDEIVVRFITPPAASVSSSRRRTGWTAAKSGEDGDGAAQLGHGGDG
jgi:hypothetical protein